MVRDFKSKLNECNNITGFILATKSYNVEAKKFADLNGIKLITDDQLPNIPGMLLLAHGLFCARRKCTWGSILDYYESN